MKKTTGRSTASFSGHFYLHETDFGFRALVGTIRKFGIEHVASLFF